MARADAAAFEAECFQTVWDSPAHREAVAALFARRAPVFEEP